MAMQTIDAAAAAGGRVRIALYYNDANLRVNSVEGHNRTTAAVTVGATDDNGVRRTYVLPAGWLGRQGISERFTLRSSTEVNEITVSIDTAIDWSRMALSVAFDTAA